MSGGTEAAVTILTAIVGLAILSVLVSRKANTSGVLGAFGQMFANMISAATGPVTGAVTPPNVGGSSGFAPFQNYNIGSLMPQTN